MRIAIIGGGIAGLTAAWQLHRLAPEAAAAGTPLHTTLFESSNRLGGIIQTVREGGFTMETGPDAWLTAKPWASDLARDLGLAEELIPSNDATRKTWIFLNQPTASPRLVPIPDGMTLMVPSDLDALQHSPLFSPAAIHAYRAEPSRAAELLASIPTHDESVADFTLRHFGPEVLDLIASPLLSGVFGGNVHALSARATLPALIQMERTHGSLIAALQAQRDNRNGSRTTNTSTPDQPAEAPALFTTLRTGVATLIHRLIAEIPPSTIRLNTTVQSLARHPQPLHADPCSWELTASSAGRRTTETFDRVLLALPAEAARNLLAPLDPEAASLLPSQSSSAVLVAFAFPDATRVPIPPGFGFLVPPTSPVPPNQPHSPTTERHTTPTPNPQTSNLNAPNPQAQTPDRTPNLLQACTFADQKFPHRVPPGGRLLRAYFSGAAAARLSPCNNDEIAAIARLELARVLHTYTRAPTTLTRPTQTPLPDPLITIVRRLPHSLPQYTVGHLDRIAELQSRLATNLPHLSLLGNTLHGLGLPDIIRQAREAARNLAKALSS